MGALHQRHDLVHAFRIARVKPGHGFTAFLQTGNRGIQLVCTFLYFGKRGSIAHGGLRNRLGQPLRLHQRIARGGHLLGHFVRAQNRPGHHAGQHGHAKPQQNEQYALMALRRALPKRRHPE